MLKDLFCRLASTIMNVCSVIIIMAVAAICIILVLFLAAILL